MCQRSARCVNNSCCSDRHTDSIICSSVRINYAGKGVSYSISMFTDYLNKYAIRSHQNQGITVCNVKDHEAGVELAKGILYEIVDKNSVLYLSGGSMQRLYELFAKEE